MNNEEAIALLEQELARFRAEPYAELVGRTTTGPVDLTRTAPSGRTYQVEIQVVWDGRPGGNIRVLGAVDDGGWRAFMPLTRDFIKAPDGSVGE